jgi:hypothetical protein
MLKYFSVRMAFALQSAIKHSQMTRIHLTSVAFFVAMALPSLLVVHRSVSLLLLVFESPDHLQCHFQHSHLN